MKTTAICALLVAGSFSLVSAAPEKKETTARISYSEDKERAAAEAEEGWVEIATPTPGKHGRVFVAVDRNASPFAKLRIEAHKGAPQVRSVIIHYDNGKQRTFKVGRTVTKKRPAFVDLPGSQPMVYVVVVTDRKAGGSYTVHGTRQPSAVATR